VAQSGRAAVAGGLADFAVFDGHEGRLSDLIESSKAEGGMPDLSNAVTEWMSTDEDAPELEQRLKNVLEGGFLGVVADGIFRGVKAIRDSRIEKAINNTVDEVESPKPELNTKPVDDFADLKIDDDGKSVLITAERQEARPAAESFDDGAVVIGEKEAGKIELSRRGDRLAVVNSVVETAQQGAGKGKVLYDEAAKLADKDGLTLVSDNSVSSSAARVWESMARRGDDIIDMRKTDPDNIDVQVKDDGSKQYWSKNGEPIFQRKARASDAEVQAEGVRQAEEAAAAKSDPEQVLETRRAETRTRVQEHMQITTDQKARFVKAVEAGNEKEALEVLQDFNENNIDWTKIDGADDIKQVLKATEEIFADLVKDATGGVQSNARTRILANLTGSTPREIHNLFRDTRGSGGLAARFYASMRTMMASAAEVKRAVSHARNNPQNAQADAAAVRAIQMHAAIQAEVKGAQTEIARALQAMSMIKESAANNFKEFDEIFRETGSTGRRGWEKEMDKFLAENVGLKEINKLTQMTPWEKGTNMFFEYTINAMLSSPKTHLINFASNVLNTGIYTLDRSLGGAYRYLTAGDRAALTEARIDLTTKYHSVGRAWELAKQAWKDGAPVTDKRQRIEFKTRNAIARDGTRLTELPANADTLPEVGQKFIARKQEAVRDNFGQVTDVVEFNGYQRVINTIGRVVRTPGRALITGDEFFKTINREAELQVQAFRKADQEAIEKGYKLGTDQYEAYVEKRTKKLTNESIIDPENIELQALAIEKARRVTFQESPQTNFGAAAEQLINSNRWVKLIFAPFFRTPMNILRQGVLDRTPLTYFTTASKEILKSGDARAIAELRARSLTGVGAMTAFYFLTTNGEEGDLGYEIVGKIPRNNAARHANVKDYSVRLGDNWYQFNRLEPFGMWLGMIADMRTHTKYADDEDDGLAYTLGAGLIASFMNNVGGKTYMKSVSDFQDMLEGFDASPAAVERAVDRFAAGEFGKLIPGLFKGTAAAVTDPEEAIYREAWDFIDILQARSFAFRSDIAPKYDMLGNTIPQDIGWSALLNPLAVSENRLDDPVYKEFWDLGFSQQPMQKRMGEYQLTSAEFSKLNGYMSQVGTYRAILSLVQAEAWDEFPRDRKIMLIKKQIEEGRKAAHALMLTDEEFVKKLTQTQIDAAFSLIE
jgi:hypothetical protein